MAFAVRVASSCFQALRPVGGPLKRGDVDALHVHQRVEGSLCTGLIGIPKQPKNLAGKSYRQKLVTG
jgi:hypothetical protein